MKTYCCATKTEKIESYCPQTPRVAPHTCCRPYLVQLGGDGRLLALDGAEALDLRQLVGVLLPEEVRLQPQLRQRPLRTPSPRLQVLRAATRTGNGTST